MWKWLALFVLAVTGVAAVPAVASSADDPPPPPPPAPTGIPWNG